MILFGVVAALLVAAALAVLLTPLLRPAAAAAAEPDPVISMYRRQLAELEIEAAQGRLDPPGFEAARIEVTRRMLAAGDGVAAVAAGSGVRAASWRIGAALGIAALLPAAALATYLGLGTPAAIDGVPNTAHQDAAGLSAAAAQLAQHLRTDPGDIAGWALLGRTMAALDRIPEAADALRHAVALAPGDPELHAQFGEMLVLAARGSVTAEAAAEFKKAPQDPRARFYIAEADLQRGDVAAGKAALAALLADSPKDAPWRRLVAERLAQIDAAPAPGPTPQDEKAAAAMPGTDRLAMIRGMVGRLAARLDADPNDPKGWLMLARSYEVLGRQADAVAALQRANEKIPGDLALEKAYLAMLAAGPTEAPLPPELVSLASRINAADANDKAALWYLGIAAQQHGDKAEAAAYWRRLLALLPQNDGDRAAVQQRLDAVK